MIKKRHHVFLSNTSQSLFNLQRNLLWQWTKRWCFKNQSPSAYKLMFVDALRPMMTMIWQLLASLIQTLNIQSSIQGRHSLFRDPAEEGLGKQPETRDKSYDLTPNQTILTHMTKTLFGTLLIKSSKVITSYPHSLWDRVGDLPCCRWALNFV